MKPDQATSQRSLLGWRRAHLGPMPGVQEIRVACGSILLIVLLLAGLSVGYGAHGASFLGHELGGDFEVWYVAGKILSEYSHERLYDLQLQSRLEHDLRPGWDPDSILVFANAPYTAVLFQPIARLPYPLAYVVWLAAAASLYLAGLALIWPQGGVFDAFPGTILLICLSFFPFAFECWFGGQLSVIGFFALALCIRCQKDHRPFQAGMALALCTYKPTILVMALPLLAVGRRFRLLFGFLTGALALVLVSLLEVGYAGCRGYLGVLKLYAEVTGGGGSVQRLHKYVDINSVLRLLSGGRSLTTLAVFVVLAAGAFICLAAAWAHSERGDQISSDLLWAATIAWTLVFNLYVPIYDTTLVVLSAVLTAGAVHSSRGNWLPPDQAHRFHILLFLLYVVPFVTQYFALLTRMQTMTLVLFALGGMELQLWKRRHFFCERGLEGGGSAVS